MAADISWDRLLRLIRHPRRTTARVSMRLERRFLPSAPSWCRVVMEQSIRQQLGRLPVSELVAVEVSGHDFIDGFEWKSATTLHYPIFDLCNPGPIDQTFDVVICNQVLEHVVDPLAAARTLTAMCRAGGTIVVATPFLLRVHEAPVDLWRFTEAGLRLLLAAAGMEVVESHSWGNAACVRGNLYRWAPMSWRRSLSHDPDLPVVVWAFARPRAL